MRRLTGRWSVTVRAGIIITIRRFTGNMCGGSWRNPRPATANILRLSAGRSRMSLTVRITFSIPKAIRLRSAGFWRTSTGRWNGWTGRGAQYSGTRPTRRGARCISPGARTQGRSTRIWRWITQGLFRTACAALRGCRQILCADT